ncbi:MAG: protein kinase [Planctomycetes bacterium]|nr:protein kinase [Planctomycetota bacterium]
MGASTEQRLGHLALERGLVTRAQLDEALAEQERLDGAGVHTRLGQILVRRRALSIEQLIELLKNQSAPGASPVPTLEHKYRIVQELGSGSGGTVYLAEDLQLGRPVALKVLRPDNMVSKTAVKRFFGEGKALAKLRHPGIVQVYEIGQVESTYFIAMEFVPGETLERHLLKGRPSFRDAAGLVAEVADAVHHAHAQGIVHRDLKPGNIMIETVGSERHVRVMDFGLAHDVFARTRLTATGAVVGTPMYMAPEQVSAQAIDARTDVYALGVILYELMCGRPPFTGRTTYELYEAIVVEDPTPPRRANPRVPVEMELIVMTALNKLPAFRYPTAQAMASDLRRFLRGEPVSAKGLSLAHKVITRARRHWVALAVAFLIVVVGAVVGTFFAGSAARERAFEHLLGQVDECVKGRDFVGASRRLGEAAVLRPGDGRMAPRRTAIARLVDDTVAEAEERLRQGQPQEAADLARRVLAVEAGQVQAAACLGKAKALIEAQEKSKRQVAERLALARERITDCEKAVTLPPSLYEEARFRDLASQARAALSENLALGEGLDVSSRAFTEYLLGRLELYEGRIDGAIEALSRAIAAGPSGQAYYARGEAHVAGFRRERAMFGGKDEDLPDVYRERIEEMRQAALEDFRKAQEMHFGSGSEIPYLEALVLHYEGRSVEALEKLEELGRVDQAAVWLLRGEILNALSRDAEAIKAYETAHDIARSDPNALLALADMRMEYALYHGPEARIMEGLDHAIAAMDMAIRIRPSVAHLYVQRGRQRIHKIEQMQFQQKPGADAELEQAKLDFETAIRLDPRDDRGHSGLGIILLQRATQRLYEPGGMQKAAELGAEFEAAAAATAQAIERNPWSGELYRDRGLALSMKGMCLMLAGKDAQPTLDEAFRLIQRAEELKYHVNTTYEALALTHLWQASLDLQKMRSMKPHLDQAIAAATRAIETSSTSSRGRCLAFRSVLRMVLAFYLFFTSKDKDTSAEMFDLGAEDMKEAAELDSMLASYDHEPILEFSRALRLQTQKKEKEAREAFQAAERKLGGMMRASQGPEAFFVQLFARSMRGFCCFYTERYGEAADEWTALTQHFPPISFVLSGWIAQARKRAKTP